MYFRCTTCLAATWIGIDGPPSAAENVTCHECGRAYIVDPAAELGVTEGSHYRHTSSFANHERLDMATAYSFLLGLISREELSAVEDLDIDEPALDEEEIRLVESLESDTPADEVPTKLEVSETPPTIDPGFQKAVARGRLTVEEALRRGDRTAYATNLSNRYKLSMELAYAVADNRITLFQARKSQEAKPKPASPVATDSSAGAGKRLAMLGIVAAAILGLTWGMSKKNEEPRTRTTSTQVRRAAKTGSSTSAGRTDSNPNAASAASTYSSTEVLTDDKQRVTRIVGLDPRTVLLTYCGTDVDSATCDPLEIMDTVPPTREVRLGTFRDPEFPDEIRAIRIQRDRFSRRWVAGDGEQPVPLTDPSEIPDGASRIAETNR